MEKEYVLHTHENDEKMDEPLHTYLKSAIHYLRRQNRTWCNLLYQKKTEEGFKVFSSHHPQSNGTVKQMFLLNSSKC